MLSVPSLLRGTSLSARLLRWAAVMILLCRGMLSGAVMFDMHAPAGSIGLVVCSGFGPMFPSVDATQNSDAMTDHDGITAPDANGGMVMDSAMVAAMAGDATMAAASAHDVAAPGGMSGGMPMHATADANDICAFSAALMLGVTALFVVLLLLCALPTVRRLRTRCAPALRDAASPFTLPLGRAPPFAVRPA